MKDLLLTLLHWAVMTATLCGPGGVRAGRSWHFIRRWGVARTADCSRRASARCSPDQKGPSEALLQAIVELTSRNPRFGCPRSARIISRTFGANIDKNVVYRVLSTHYRPIPGGTGPSWVSFIGHTIG